MSQHRFARFVSIWSLMLSVHTWKALGCWSRMQSTSTLRATSIPLWTRCCLTTRSWHMTTKTRSLTWLSTSTRLSTATSIQTSKKTKMIARQILSSGRVQELKAALTRSTRQTSLGQKTKRSLSRQAPSRKTRSETSISASLTRSSPLT